MIPIYHILWTVVIICCLPFILFLAVTGHKRIKERLALCLPEFTNKNKRIWIHALSVGEVISAVPLIGETITRYPDKEIVFTVTTKKGLEIARKEVGNRVKIIPMPLDFWWSINRIIRNINPYFFILVETDIWPALINSLSDKNIRCFLVNGRISPRTYESYKKFSFLVKPLFNRFTLCMMQSELDRKRLLDIGTDPERVITAGNIKFDSYRLPMESEERETLLEKFSLDPEDDILVAGSVHGAEGEVVLNIFSELAPDFPKLRLIIAPRNIEESGRILKSAQDIGLKAILKTDLPVSDSQHKVIVLNTIGELSRIYGIAKISFVGGSLVPSGGHNLLEPASFGCPVLFGPHMHNFVLMSELLQAEKGGYQANDEKELYAFIRRLLENNGLCESTGKNAKRFVDRHKGALKEALNRIRELSDADKAA